MSMREEKNRKRKKRKMQRMLLRLIPFCVAILLIAIVIVVSLKTGVLEKYSYSYEKADLNEYFKLTSTDQVPLLLDNKYSNGKVIFVGGKYYLDKDFVSEYFDANYYFDENENLLLYTTGDQTISYDEGKDFVKKDSQLFIELGIVSEYAALDYKEYDNPRRIELFYKWDDTINIAEVVKNTQCRVLGGIKSEVLTDIVKGSKIQILSEMDEWSEIKTEDGFIGYIQNKVIDNYSTESMSAVSAKKTINVPHVLYNEKICLGWHQVMSQEANATFENALEGTKGLNVLSPTWMSVGDNSGNISSIGSQDYVAKAHERGIRVWALVDNFLDGIDMYSILSHTSTRQNLINSLVSSTMAVNADGINVDFENLNVECGPHFAQFIRELALVCHQNGLVLSVDNYVPKEYTSFYHREVQGQFADYVVIMGYDEHYSGSEEAGSVASFDYVQSGIENTLHDVPAAQVINGIPFYTRIWHEGASLDSEAVGMAEAEKYVNNMGGTIVWDEATAQNYAEFKDSDGRNCKVWLEDKKSIGVKLGLVNANNLGGVAFWKLGLEKSSVWDEIAKYLVNQ